MALVVVCGSPLSGKTEFSKQLFKFFEEKKKDVKHVCEDELFKENRSKAYENFQIEKKSRLKFKSQIQLHMGGENVVVADAVNNIKGFRYELNCISRLFEGEYCTVFFDLPLNVLLERNEKLNDRWERSKVEELFRLMEKPNPKNAMNKFERPIFIFKENDPKEYEKVFEEIYELVFEKKRDLRRRHMHDFKKDLTSGNVMKEIDTITNTILKNIMTQKGTCSVGQLIKVHPDSTQRYKLPRGVTIGKLRKLRKTFIRTIEADPPKEVKEIPDLFIVFLNSN